MHLADSPTQDAGRTLRRVPVFVTGNDLSKVYAPLRRPGRMRPFFWRPTEAERQEIVECMMAPLLDAAETAGLLAQLTEAPIAFFADLLVAMKARSVQSVLHKYAEDLKVLVVDATRAGRDLENHMRQQRAPAGEIVTAARTLWRERTVATTSYLNK